MFSVLAASVFAVPLRHDASEILVLNLLYDVSCTAMPWDNVDEDFLRKPRSWNTDSIRRFMFWLQAHQLGL